MKHDQLWNDTLDAGLPGGLASSTLAAMRGEGRRIRRRRRVTCASALVIAAGLLTWLALPKQETQPPAVAHSIPSDAKAKPSGASHIRYLSDAELISRLREVGIGIGVAGAGDQKEILLVSRQGEVFRP